MTDWPRIVAAVMLGVGGSIALYMGENTVAASCFGFLGGWLLKNGIQTQKTIT